MGGWNSGRRGGKPVKEVGTAIDLALMLCKGWRTDGKWGNGRLTWSDSTGWSASINYQYDMLDPNNASLTLTYRNRRGGEDWIDRKQSVRLVYTVTPFGGRRWWVSCPVLKHRAGELYLPAGGDVFASRKAWGLAYRSQRSRSRNRAFNWLFALQRRLGCPEGWSSRYGVPRACGGALTSGWRNFTGTSMPNARERWFQRSPCSTGASPNCGPPKWREIDRLGDLSACARARSKAA
jgi:hypothetical protein